MLLLLTIGAEKQTMCPQRDTNLIGLLLDNSNKILHRHFYYIYTAAQIPDILSKTIFIDFRRQYCQKTPFNFILTLAPTYI